MLFAHSVSPYYNLLSIKPRYYNPYILNYGDYDTLFSIRVPITLHRYAEFLNDLSVNLVTYLVVYVTY